jgi:hypothetical protein
MAKLEASPQHVEAFKALAHLTRLQVFFFLVKAGALEEGEYRAKLAKAGFEAVGLEPTRIYQADDAREFLAREGEHIAVSLHAQLGAESDGRRLPPAAGR